MTASEAAEHSKRFNDAQAKREAYIDERDRKLRDYDRLRDLNAELLAALRNVSECDSQDSWRLIALEAIDKAEQSPVLRSSEGAK